MEVIYPIGRVYKLVSTNGLVYVGSTKKPLYIRLSEHKSDFKRYSKDAPNNRTTSVQLFENNCLVEIFLLEEHTDISKLDLYKRERHHIENTACVNRCVMGRTKKEYKFTHKVEKANSDKKYYYKNLDTFKIKAREYYHKNKESILERQKQQSYKDKKSESRKERIICDVCDLEMRKDNKKKHNMSAKHIKNQTIINSNTVNITIS